MTTLLTISGAFIGWILVEFFSVFAIGAARARIPIGINFMAAFVGAVVAYHLVS